MHPAALLSAAEAVIADVRYALRSMRRDRAFTTAALVTLSLGIGLNTAIFSVAYAVLWRPLPYPDPDRLVMVSSAQQDGRSVRPLTTWAPTSYEGLSARATSFDQLAAYTSLEVEVTGRGEPLLLPALEVSPNFFATLGVGPVWGRPFETGDTAPRDATSAIVTDRMWRSVLNADRTILGQSITIGGRPRTVVGVLPPDFRFRPLIRNGTLPAPDVFLPGTWRDPDGSASLFLVGRLGRTVTAPQAEAELSGLLSDASLVPAGALSQAGAFDANARTIARVERLQQHGTGRMRPLLLILLGAVTCVLLIACTNVLNLQVARFMARRGELLVRLALGAGRARVVRQLVTESIVLSAAGAAVGLLLAKAAILVTLPLVPESVLPRLSGIEIDGTVALFTAALSVFSTLIVGVVPALKVSRALLRGAALHAGETRTTGDRRGDRFRASLVALQIAMTLVLLAGAGLLILSFVRLSSVSPGFDASGPGGVIQTVRVTLPERLFAGPSRMQQFARGVLERVRYVPGVTSASLVNSAPFGMMFIQTDFFIEGRPKPALFAGTPKIEPAYFATMGIPVLAGREFTERDTEDTLKVAIVSERIVREYFSGAPAQALGRRLKLDERGDWLTIVGVVTDIRQRGLDQDVKPMIYSPYQQERAQPFLLRFVSFVVRTSAPASVVEGIRAEIRRAAPDLPIASTATMDEAIAASVAAPRFRTGLLVIFASTALMIAMSGLYGLMAYAVQQRRREIGVRMALGATPPAVGRLVIGRAIRIVAVGVAAGFTGAAAMTRVLQSLLFEVTATDPLVFITSVVLLMAAGLIAAWLPARRASHIDPWTALRAD
jgi:predicted permease